MYTTHLAIPSILEGEIETKRKEYTWYPPLFHDKCYIGIATGTQSWVLLSNFHNSLILSKIQTYK